MTASRGAAIMMRELVLAAMLGAYRHVAAAPSHYSANTYGWPVARKCPTLMHSVRPTRTRRASG